MAQFNHEDFECCFNNWIAQQHQDLDQLLALNSDPEITDEKLKPLVETGIKHFQEYMEKRALMCQRDAPSYLSPNWCSSFENAYLWIGGCRPSLSIRLVYSVCGLELNAQLGDFLGGQRKGNLAELSAHQLEKINALHCKIIKDEDKMSKRMASLQEDIADDPLTEIAKNAGQVGELSRDVNIAMDAHSQSLACILVDADKLRLDTIKELMGILMPLQAVDLLVATKKLHLSMHEWGKKREKHHLGKCSQSIVNK